MKNLELEGAELKAMPKIPPSAPADKNTICVFNIPHGKNETVLKMLFENTRRSGGGDIKEMSSLTDSSYRITYREEAGNAFCKCFSRSMPSLSYQCYCNQ